MYVSSSVRPTHFRFYSNMSMEKKIIFLPPHWSSQQRQSQRLSSSPPPPPPLSWYSLVFLPPSHSKHKAFKHLLPLDFPLTYLLRPFGNHLSCPAHLAVRQQTHHSGNRARIMRHHPLRVHQNVRRHCAHGHKREHCLERDFWAAVLTQALCGLA